MSKKHRKVRKVLFRKQRGLCCYCRVPMTLPPRPDVGKTERTMATLEHLRRKADGGTDHRDNLALACHRCNSGRHGVDWFTYASRKQGEMVA